MAYAAKGEATSNEPTYREETVRLSRIQPRKRNAASGHSSILSHPEEQDIEIRKHGRAAIIGYNSATGGVRVHRLNLAQHDQLPIEPSLVGNARLFILENVGTVQARNFARLLKLPKRVFSLHWEDPEEHIHGDAHVPLGEDPKQHFILHYVQPLPFKMTHPGSEEVNLVCNAKRKIIHRIPALKELQTKENEMNEQLVSYYTGRLDGREIAVLLVDPCPSILDQFPDGQGADPLEPLPHMDLNRTESPWYDWTKEDEESEKPYEPPTVSMYDELVQYFKSLDKDQAIHLEEKAPYGWAYRCCSIVLARNASTVQSSYAETWRLTYKASAGVKNLVDFDYDKVENKAWSDDWKGEFFSQLWELREELELMQYKLQRNKQVLSGLVASSTNVNKTKNVFINTGGGNIILRDYVDYRSEESGNATDLPTIDKDKGKEQGATADIDIESTLERELEEWDRITKLNSYSIQLMDRTTETYVQAIGATQAQFANEQTKNSKKLTGFAAVFVPASLCAAILAIPSFSPDSPSLTKFIAFWGVSVPLAVICAVLFLTGLPHWLKSKLRRAFHKPTEEDVEKAAETAPSGEDMFRRPRRQIPTRNTTVASGRNLSL